jgi:hypothetical protein
MFCFAFEYHLQYELLKTPFFGENCRNIGGASYGHDIRKFEKKLMHLQMLCGGLPTNKF